MNAKGLGIKALGVPERGMLGKEVARGPWGLATPEQSGALWEQLEADDATRKRHRRLWGCKTGGCKTGVVVSVATMRWSIRGLG